MVKAVHRRQSNHSHPYYTHNRSRSSSVTSSLLSETNSTMDAPEQVKPVVSQTLIPTSPESTVPKERNKNVEVYEETADNSTAPRRKDRDLSRSMNVEVYDDNDDNSIAPRPKDRDLSRSIIVFKLLPPHGESGSTPDNAQGGHLVSHSRSVFRSNSDLRSTDTTAGSVKPEEYILTISNPSSYATSIAELHMFLFDVMSNFPAPDNCRTLDFIVVDDEGEDRLRLSSMYVLVESLEQLSKRVRNGLSKLEKGNHNNIWLFQPNFYGLGNVLRVHWR